MASQLSLEKKINVVAVLDDILAPKKIPNEIAFFLQNWHENEKCTKMLILIIFVHSLQSTKNASNYLLFRRGITKKYLEKVQDAQNPFLSVRSCQNTFFRKWRQFSLKIPFFCQKVEFFGIFYFDIGAIYDFWVCNVKNVVNKHYWLSKTSAY